MTATATVETTTVKLSPVEKIKLATEKKLAATRAKIIDLQESLVNTCNRKVKSAEKKGEARYEDFDRMEANQLATALRVYEERCKEIKDNFADKRAEHAAAVEAEIAEIKRVFGTQNVDSLMNGHDAELSEVDPEF